MTTTPRALLLDFGGVLTNPIIGNLPDVDARHGLEPGTTMSVLAHAYADGGEDSAIARLERGELDIPDFERELAADLELPVLQEGRFVAAVFGDLVVGGRLWSAAQLLRADGVRTCLLSNSWGVDGYPRDLLAATFDELVISGEVGMRKPDAAIYELAAEKAGVPTSECVFVDDHPGNLEAAAALGMSTVHHRGDHDEVVDELSTLFDRDLSDAVDLADLSA